MRIKVDYVTNSSSTCYVVCIPQDKKWILENLPTFDEYYEEDEPASDKDELSCEVENLLRGETIWEEEAGEWFRELVELCEKNGFIIASFEVGSERGQITNITEKDFDKIKEILKKGE